MKRILVSVRDIKADAYFPPQLCDNDYTAIRSFKDVVCKDGPINAHPEDYQLFRIASMDMYTGVVTPESAPVLLINASSCHE